MSQCADSIRVMRPLFQAEEGGSTPTSALQLHVERTPFDVARRLNRCWHSRLPDWRDPAGTENGGIHYAATFCDVVYAVAIWTHPVARLLPQETWLELRRLAIAPDAPRNTASRMLAVMVRLIRKERPHVERLVSYQDTAVHAGGIYRAAGWTPTTTSGGDKWDRPGRSRPTAQSTARKQRWELSLV